MATFRLLGGNITTLLNQLGETDIEDRIYTPGFFDIGAAVSADATTIVAKTNWGPHDYDLDEDSLYPDNPAPDGSEETFDLTLTGAFSYGPLNTVTGTVSAMVISYNGLDLATVTGMNADASEVWATLQTQSEIDYLKAAFAGNDKILGTNFGDELYGGLGRDTIKGFGGDDVIRGGGWADVIEGGNGADRLFGGNGFDSVKGGSGDDRLFGGRGNDTLSGGLGNDIVTGGSGNDELSGGDQLDQFVFHTGQAGNDTIVDWTLGEAIILRYAMGLPEPAVNGVQDGANVVIDFAGATITVLNADIDDVGDSFSLEAWSY